MVKEVPGAFIKRVLAKPQPLKDNSPNRNATKGNFAKSSNKHIARATTGSAPKSTVPPVKGFVSDDLSGQES
jgi:hypothetical protein